MPAAYRLGDTASGHDDCPPTAATGASADVFFNGQGAARQGDPCAPHGCRQHDTHERCISGGSGTVFINGRPAARVGDGIGCGGAAASGSGDVSIGG